ncbi:MAG TPA: SIS domain-containing protein, partial [Candidatus Angelobacter sp.]|nr:SIS domain-containing protein [Candidatus Angelobacter sp.]
MSKGKNGFAHYMIKEIYDQPEAVRTVVEDNLDSHGKVVLQQLGLSRELIRTIDKITIAASGSSRHAGMVGEFMLERMVGLNVEVDFASQYCYRDPVVSPHELTIFPSQSGTTIDTITALQVARKKGASSLAICNVPETPLTQLADATLLTHAGEEVAIAATKSFTTQLAVLYLLTLSMARLRGRMTAHSVAGLIEQLERLPELLASSLESWEQQMRAVAEHTRQARGFLYLGRGIHYAIAREGALKLKESAYIQAEGYPAGELKHGPNALVSKDAPLVMIATQDRDDPDSVLRYEKTLQLMKDMKEQGA